MTGGLSLTVQQSPDVVFGLLRAKAHTDRELYVYNLYTRIIVNDFITRLGRS